jgi:hypothetical protein
MNARQTKDGNSHKRETARHLMNPKHRATISNNTRTREREDDNMMQSNSGTTNVESVKTKQKTPITTIAQVNTFMIVPSLAFPFD